MALFRLLTELTFRGVLHPRGATIELDQERDARKVKWLAEQGVIAGSAGAVAKAPGAERAPRRALQTWASGCCGRR